MGRYVVNSPAEQQDMLKEIGLNKLEDLYVDVPAEAFPKHMDLPEGKSELEVSREMQDIADKNTVFKTCFRGAGAYRHYIPAIVTSVTSKEQFVTTYTPYQAEISQGVLQSIFEYQTQMCELTGLDVSNASVYDGAVAAAEAVFMCLARNKNRILVSATVNPETLAVIRTYCESRSVIVDVVGLSEGQTDLEELSNKLDSTVCAVLVQSPNFYGILEETVKISEITHNGGAKMILSANPIAFGLLKSAKEQGADICVGEGQPLGLPLSFGGPYLGYMTATKDMMRKLPGRIVGQTVDHDGNRCYVLTLQAREQHIRREKASSNICSNEALCAMTASVYLAAVGPDGLKQVASNSASYAHYMEKRLEEVGFKLKYNKEFFNEFLVESPVDIDVLEKKLAEKGILSGLKTSEGLLLCCTELNNVKEIDAFIETVKEVL